MATDKAWWPLTFPDESLRYTHLKCTRVYAGRYIAEVFHKDFSTPDYAVCVFTKDSFNAIGLTAFIKFDNLLDLRAWLINFVKVGYRDYPEGNASPGPPSG